MFRECLHFWTWKMNLNKWTWKLNLENEPEKLNLEMNLQNEPEKVNLKNEPENEPDFLNLKILNLEKCGCFRKWPRRKRKMFSYFDRFTVKDALWQ